jgi:hypothetical protein
LIIISSSTSSLIQSLFSSAIALATPFDAAAVAQASEKPKHASCQFMRRLPNTSVLLIMDFARGALEKFFAAFQMWEISTQRG